MLSDSIVRSTFIISTLERDLQNIHDAQLLIAKKNIYIEGKALKTRKRKGATIGVRTGSLIRSLENPDYRITSNGAQFIVTDNIVKQLRFKDMKHLGNYRIYNRQVWGILYNNSLPDLRQNMGREIRDLVGEELQRAFKEY